MLNKLALGLIISSTTASAIAQSVTDIQAGTGNSAYLQDARGVVVRSGSGLCWRSGDWTPADALPGCDGPLLPPIAKPTAPALQTAPAPSAPVVPVTPAPVAATSKRCDAEVTLTNDQAFAFNSAVLTGAAKKRIDSEVMSKLGSCDKVDTVIVTGHSDRLGSQQYNRKLSEKRAASVAAYLKSKGMTAPIETMGMGKSQPIKACNERLPHKKLIECLAPNRRVTIEFRGIAK